MAKHASEWAATRGLERTNPVHGEQEFRVPTDFTFANTNIDRHSTSASSGTQLEAGLRLIRGVRVPQTQGAAGLLAGEDAELTADAMATLLGFVLFVLSFGVYKERGPHAQQRPGAQSDHHEGEEGAAVFPCSASWNRSI